MEPAAKKPRLTGPQDAGRVEKARPTSKRVKMDDLPNDLLLELFQHFDRDEREDRQP